MYYKRGFVMHGKNWKGVYPMRWSITTLLAISILIPSFATAEDKPEPCEYSKLKVLERMAHGCTECHLALDGRAGRTQIPGYNFAKELKPLRQIDTVLQNDRDFQRYVKPIINKERTTHTLEGNRSNVRVDRQNTTLIGVTNNDRVVVNNEVRPNEPVVTNTDFGSLDGSGFFTNSAPVITDYSEVETENAVVRTNPIDGENVDEILYTMKRNDIIETVVANIFEQELKKKDINHRPSGQVLDQLVELIRRHNAMRWGFGEPVEGDIVGIPRSYIEKYASLLKQVEQNQNEDGDDDDEEETDDYPTYTPDNTENGFNTEDGDAPLQGYTPVNNASDEEIAKAAVDELEALEKKIEALIDEGIGNNIIKEGGSNISTFRLNDQTQGILRKEVIGLIDNGNSATRSCPIGMGDDFSALRSSVEILNQDLSSDYHIFGMGRESVEKKNEAIKKATDELTKIRNRVREMKRKVRAWKS